MSGSLRGISMSLPGASSVGVGCLCRPEERMWSTLGDVYNTMNCARCNRTWHKCLMHLIDVSGMPPSNGQQCTCNRVHLPATQNCPYCGGAGYLMPHEQSSTKICKNCHQGYHTCRIHGKSVKGPGYALSALEQSRCLCHEDLPFLGQGWNKPFN